MGIRKPLASRRRTRAHVRLEPVGVKDYRRGSHTVWDCKYDLVWITKYRYAVLLGNELASGTARGSCHARLREASS